MKGRGKAIWEKFKLSKRNLYSLYIFSFLFVLSIFAEVISNDKPILMMIDDKLYFPLIIDYKEVHFGGVFETEADYKDNFMQDLIKKDDNWAVFPLNPNSYNTINLNNSTPNPAPPSMHNLSLIHI